MFGKADPYVVVSVGDNKFESRSISNNLNPEWNFENSFTVDDEFQEDEENITLEVFDKDVVSRDDLMGTVKIAIKDIAKFEKGQWIQLNDGDSGELFLIITPMNVGEGGKDKETTKQATCNMSAENEIAEAALVERKALAEAEAARQSAANFGNFMSLWLCGSVGDSDLY